MMFVADTHSLLWFVAGSPQLGKGAKGAFEMAERGEATALIPSIVLAESMHILEKLGTKEKFKELLSKVRDSSNYVPIPLDTSIIEKAYDIDLPDIHDRIISATAVVFRAPLVTKDREISMSGIIETIW